MSVTGTLAVWARLQAAALISTLTRCRTEAVAMRSSALSTHAAPGQTMTIDEICRLAQPYCNEQMRVDHFNQGARGHTGGWKSNTELLKYNLFVQVSGGATAWSKCPYGRAPARLLCLLGARQVAPGS